MNILLYQHKSGQMLQAVKQSLTWMPETFDARYLMRWKWRRRRENNKIVEEGIITLRRENSKIEGKY